MKKKYPSPECDEACYYHCTKGGQQEPECVMKKNIFLDLHLKRCEGSFWDENFKSTIILLLECSYQKEVLREWGISDLVVNGDKILLQWYKRFIPLTDEEILTKYGR